VTARALRISGFEGLMACALLALVPLHAHADAGWFESGDVGLRMDLALLNDAEVIRLPTTQWPMPRAAVAYALANAKEHAAANSAVIAALERVRQRLGSFAQLRFEARAAGGDPGLLRGFDEVAREKGELGARAEFDGERFSASLNVTAVTDAADGQSVRPDGSHGTIRLGNWLVSANTQDRFWGPAHDSSLILSNNARPMPTLVLERAEPRPFESRWLNWLGPWRFSLGVSRMETERQDIDSPLFLAWRVTVMPFKDIEVGFSRTAQFCGEQLACDFSSIVEMLIGNDNVGIDASEENEPGNQMAGFDMRWASPIGDWPYAVYSQMIGEDESGYLPVKYLAQFGIETWKPLGDGGMLQFYAEYADTTCSANRRPPRFNCAYNQGRFNVEGYRYRGRVMGHTTDRDAETYSIGAMFQRARGDVWTASARFSDLNRDAQPDLSNTVSPGPAEYASLELGWRGRWHDQKLAIDLGVASLEPLGFEREYDAYGFLSWTYEFPP
jgi:hypothetical protein